MPGLDPELRESDSCCLELYLAIGVLFKSECTDTTGKIYLNTLISKGYSVFLSYDRNFNPTKIIKPKDEIELFYYITTLDDLKKQVNKLKLKYIFKDTTCSMTQHAGKLLGYRLECLEYLNLNNKTYAYDTYNIYIQYLKNYLRQNPPTG